MRVYVSSTSEDLKEYRQAVIAAIRKLDEGRGLYLVVCMEDYSAQDALPVDKCRQDVADCDVYVGLFAWRYGFIPEGFDRSITELEYRQAVAGGRTVLPFLLQEDVPWPRRFMDGGEKGEKLEQLRQELMRNNLCVFFTTPEELAREVVTNLIKVKESTAAQEEPPQADEGPERWLKPYLHWLEETHSTLDLIGVKRASRLPVPLEKVYVALRGDRTGAFELIQSRELLLEELEQQAPGAPWEELPPALRRQLQAKYLRNDPHMLSLRERDRPGDSSSGRTITLAEAFRKERWLVILGDPGSGKTTLARWLTLALARGLHAALDGAGDRVSVPANQVDPETPHDRRPLDLGPARLPILVRVAEFAEAQAEANARRDSLPLIDWLGRLRWQNQAPTWQGRKLPPEDLDRLFRWFLGQGRAVVLLDGLDEITEASERGDVVRAIEQFLRDWVSPTGQPACAAALWGQPASEPAQGGNQLLVTSRIAGYHAAPLTAANLTHVTIEPMRRPAVEHFCNSWMRAVHAMLAPAEPPAAVESRAVAQARGLIRAIYDADRPGVAEVASNPLLVTILALLYHKNEGRLPGSRAQLYQTAIETLIEDWRDSGLSLEQTLYVLPPLAAHIHETSPTGLIQEADVERLVMQHLALYEGVPADPPPPRLREAVRRFVAALRDQVGLLAARGQDLYGFLHLTFQEYLAARHLLGNPRTAAAEMAERLGDPRWREPMLLALGYAAWKWPSGERARLYEALLAADDPLGNLLPRAALLLVDALADLHSLPPSTSKEVTQRLLGGYSERATPERFPILRRRVEEAFLRLRQAGPVEVMDEVLCEALATPGQAPAAAALVRGYGWFTPEIVEALPGALEHDSAAWDWPIERCLRDLVSPDWPEADPPPPVAPDKMLRQAVEELRRLDSGEMLAEAQAAVERDRAEGGNLRQLEQLSAERDELIRYGRATFIGRYWDADVRDRLADIRARLGYMIANRASMPAREERLRKLLAGGQEYRDPLLKTIEEAQRKLEQWEWEKWAEIQREVKRYQLALARARLRVRAAAPPASGLQRLLESRPALARQLTGEAAWLSLFAAVAGGYPNCRGDLRSGESDRIGQVIRPSREEIEAREKLARQPVEFRIDALYRTSPLEPLLLSALNAGAVAPERLVGGLRRAWDEEPTPRGKADALAALIAVGEDVTELLSSALALPGPGETNRADQTAPRQAPWRALANLARLAAFLSDSVCRAAQRILGDLFSFHEQDAATWIDVVEPVLMALIRAARGPVSTSNPKSAAPPDYAAALAADDWYRTFSDDRSGNATAVLLQKLPAAGELIALLTTAWRSPNRRWARSPFIWEVEPVPPRPDGDDLPVEALAALEALHPGRIRHGLEAALYAAAVDRFAPLAAANSDLLPELLIFCVAFGGWEKLYSLAPQLEERRDLIAALAELARAVPSGYHRARALLRLAGLTWRPEERRLLLREAVDSAAGLGFDRRCRIFELALARCGEPEREGLLEQALGAAHLIEDHDQRCRALVRLARRLSGVRRLETWRRALAAAGAIPDEERRAETLGLIGPFVPEDAALAGCWAEAVGELTGRRRARACGRRAGELLRQVPASLESKVRAAPAAWAAVLLAAAVHEVLDRFAGRQGLRGWWLALAAGPSESAVTALVEQGRSDGLALTLDAAGGIAALAESNDRAALLLLLPLLQGPTPEALPVVQSWLAHANPLVKSHAALLLAEDGRKINQQTLPGLVWLLEHGPDRSRCRAHLAVASPIWAASKRPTLSVSRLGRDVLEAVARCHTTAGDNNRYVSLVLHEMYADWLHDDPDALRHWAAGCAFDQPDFRVHRVILRYLGGLSDQTWPVFCELLGSSVSAFPILFDALCRLIYQRKVPPEHLPVALAALRSRATEDLAREQNLVLPREAVLEVALAALEKGGPPADTIADAEAMLRDRAIKLTTSLDSLVGLADEELAEQLGRIGSNFFIALDGSDNEAEGAAQRVVEKPQVFPLLLGWLQKTLAGDADDSIRYQQREALLCVAGAVVRSLPSTFAKHADPRLWEPLLEQAAVREGSLARRSALELLSRLRRLTPRVVRVLLPALRDERHFQDSARRAIEQLSRVSGNILPPLLEGLKSDNAQVALGAARMLSIVGRYEKTPPAQRQQLLAALAAALRDRRSLQGIYRFTGSGKDENNPVRIMADGRLDHVLYETILQITGMVQETARAD